MIDCEVLGVAMDLKVLRAVSGVNTILLEHKIQQIQQALVCVCYASN